MVTGFLGTLITFFILLSSVCKSYEKYLSFDTITQKDLTQYLSKVNRKALFAERGMYWRVHRRRFWLELVIKRNRHTNSNLSNFNLLGNHSADNHSRRFSLGDED